MADARDLLPDQQILSDIFPDVPNITPDLCTVISNTFKTCTFRLSLATEPRPGFPRDLIIRLETSGRHLATVVELQQLAHHQIPHLVPATLVMGSATNANGRQVDYSITSFLVGTTVLEEVWEGLDQRNQQSLMEAIVVAMGELQKVSIHNPEVHQIIQRYCKTAPESQLLRKASLGNRNTGFHSDIKKFLEATLDERTVKLKACEILDTGHGIAVRSAVDEIGGIELSQSDLDHLMSHIVFCHNDLEPRNILIKQVGDSGSGKYELAAIIDWEMAGFYPFAYESAIKDTEAGSGCQWFNWYSLYKEHTAKFIPKEESHEKLIKAVQIIAASQESTRGRNVGVQVRAKWIKRERLAMSSDVRLGWVREDGAGQLPASTKQANYKLELEVLREMGYI